MQPAVPQHPDDASDYGSDFTPDEEELLSGLISGAPEPDIPAVLPELRLEDIDEDEGARGARLPLHLSQDDWIHQAPSLRVSKRPLVVEIDGDKNAIPKKKSGERRAERERSVSIEAPIDPAPEVPDLRSPLERFRTKPKKALSVTDLVSPSWCELQYWYVLTKHGRKRRTPAMKQGSAVHKALEDQVHTTVKVDIQTKEDAWGLRIWNSIQGTRTLRETGMTRELEVWGVVDGQVVNGVIDELSYICPDRELEEAQEKSKVSKHEAAADQTTITDFLGSAGTLENKGFDLLKNIRSSQTAVSKIYLVDVKTRGVKSVPKGASFRPTLLQLMLYHRLLANLANNKVDADIIFNRYGLDADKPFTDSFIAQIGNLNEGFDSTHSSQFQSSDASNQTDDSMTLLLAHNSLRSLWTLMISEFARTMPAGEKSLGNVLTAEYRNQTDGEILGSKSFLYDEKTTSTYLADEMAWWRGERAAKGVDVEEAYKCGYCEFFEECSWRKNKIEDATAKMRARTKSVV